MMTRIRAVQMFVRKFTPVPPLDLRHDHKLGASLWHARTTRVRRPAAYRSDGDTEDARPARGMYAAALALHDDARRPFDDPAYRGGVREAGAFEGLDHARSRLLRARDEQSTRGLRVTQER